MTGAECSVLTSSSEYKTWRLVVSLATREAVRVYVTAECPINRDCFPSLRRHPQQSATESYPVDLRSSFLPRHTYLLLFDQHSLSERPMSPRSPLGHVITPTKSQSRLRISFICQTRINNLNDHIATCTRSRTVKSLSSGSRHSAQYINMNGHQHQQQYQQQLPAQSPYGAPVEGWMANHGVPWWMVPPPNVSRVTPWSEEKIDELQDRLRLKLGPEFIINGRDQAVVPS